MLKTFFKTFFKTIFKTFFKTFVFLVNWAPGGWEKAWIDLSFLLDKWTSIAATYNVHKYATAKIACMCTRGLVKLSRAVTFVKAIFCDLSMMMEHRSF